MKKITLIFVLALIYACFNKSNNKENDFVEAKDAKMDSINMEKKMLGPFNVNSLSGHWFQPHTAMINITFKKDGSFEYNSFNVKSMQDEKLIGNYTISNNKIVMNVTNMKDRREIFDIKINEGGYFIENEGCYMVKSSEE